MIYGGGNAPGNMMRLIKLADKGIPLPFKKINNKRDFINIRNLVQILNVIIRKQLQGVFILSEGQSVSTEYLLKCIETNLGKKVPVFKTPLLMLNIIKSLRPKEYQKLFGSSIIESNYQFYLEIKMHTVEQGISEMVAWYKQNKN